ncbi:hypothetical protein SAY86_026434 [Trapa natans]|uniref:Uncharacterized protein n=1 Tax=Trapa natans TaxID=22666 RepID=A0AAN7KHX0_TRANT|nr:hypothetical protein SAY86_026434 [Trapa natans]
MGGGAQDAIAVHSSIALLQERFRQIQRMKEMREEKELQRLLSKCPSKSLSVPHQKPNYEPFSVFFEPGFGFPLDSASSQLSLSLWPRSRSDGGSCLWPMEAPVLVRPWLSGTRSLMGNLSDKPEGFEDVDTSLHLPHPSALPKGKCPSLRRILQRGAQFQKQQLRKEMITQLGQFCLASSSLWLLGHELSSFQHSCEMKIIRTAMSHGMD